MSVSVGYVLHGIVTPSSFYSQLESASPRSGVGSFNVIPAGHTQPLFVGAHEVKPEITFGTHQLATALAEFGILGSDLSAGNVDFHYKKLDELADRVADASTAHIRLRAAEAFGYLQSISANQGQLATASGTLALAYDGTNAPLVPAGSLALGGTPTGTENFTLGPVSINGSAVNGVQSMSIELNPEVIMLSGDGEVYSTFIAIKSIAPVVTITTHTLDAWASYGLGGTALSAFSAFLRKKDADGDNIANATASHIGFSGATGKVTVESSDGTGSDPATATIKIELRAANAAGNALTVNTATAIS